MELKVNAPYISHKQGLVVDIEESELFVEYLDMRFYFTSHFYLNNFVDRFEDKLKIVENRIAPYLPKPHESTIDGLDVMNALNLYNHIEKRGCRINLLHTGEVIRCLDEITVQVQFLRE